MFNLHEILRNAQGGQALERFGFGSFASALREGQHLAAFTGPGRRASGRDRAKRAEIF
jgi:hypothetical protein